MSVLLGVDIDIIHQRGGVEEKSCGGLPAGPHWMVMWNESSP